MTNADNFSSNCNINKKTHTAKEPHRTHTCMQMRDGHLVKIARNKTPETEIESQLPYSLYHCLRSVAVEHSHRSWLSTINYHPSLTATWLVGGFSLSVRIRIRPNHLQQEHHPTSHFRARICGSCLSLREMLRCCRWFCFLVALSCRHMDEGPLEIASVFFWPCFHMVYL